ncbi:hypothetical protein QQ045_030967 [Rhodiola kirilowii]
MAPATAHKATSITPKCQPEPPNYSTVASRRVEKGEEGEETGEVRAGRGMEGAGGGLKTGGGGENGAITSAQNDGMTLSTIERFKIPSFDEYDRDNMGNFDNDDEEGYVEVPICSKGVNSSLWDFPPFNDVFDLMSHPTIKGHDSNNSQFNTKVIKEGGMFMRKEFLIYACQKYSIKHRREYHTASSSTKRLILECRRGKDKCKWELRALKNKNEGM